MSKGRDVLIVEDDPDVRELFAFVLRDAGARVIAVDSGEDGVRAAVSFRPDLVVTDISMPRMDGIEMVRRLRDQEPTKDIPVVALTGHLVADIPEKARGVGCNEVLAKPCLPDALIRTVNLHIGRRFGDRAAGVAGSCLATAPPHAIDRRRELRRSIPERRRPGS
jgi:two-component system cell cycle response regulator DivK